MSLLKQDNNADRSSDDDADADSDLEELQGDIAKYDKSVRDFLASYHDKGDTSSAPRGTSRGRVARGPRKAAKPRGDITARLSRVNQAFLARDYPRALDLAFEVIRINAETHQAWTALASIFREQGELSRALSAMVYAAHLRPKDVSGWVRCASFALDISDGDSSSNLHTARLCYSAALRADPNNLDARANKASVCHKQGHLAAAISEYKIVLKHNPQDLELVRKLAEACIDSKDPEVVVPTAIEAYRHYFDHEIEKSPQTTSPALWYDVGIYVELFGSTGRYRDGIKELKVLSRWLVGRLTETYWDNFQGDDREWDVDNDRRCLLGEFMDRCSDISLYGRSLPLDMRARLAIYRLRMQDEDEAMRHLLCMDIEHQRTHDFVVDFPFLAQDLASEIARCGHAAKAAQFLEVLCAASETPDASVFLELGRCYLAIEKQSAAEECFLAAIDADGQNIDARIELANMYEKAREEEEALILAAEAMALREARGEEHTTSGLVADASAPSSSRPPNQRARVNVPRKTAASTLTSSTVPRRYRPKRLAGPARRLQDEQALAIKLSHEYESVCNLKRQIRGGREDLIFDWMRSSQELVDDFRSIKQFYSWETYLHFLRSRGRPVDPDAFQSDTELTQMYERLVQTMAPRQDNHYRGRETRNLPESGPGISIDQWLDIFLDYAIGLAIHHRRDEAYMVCQTARDSAAFQSPEHNFSIHVAWSVCAIYLRDEEKCMAVARHLMKDGGMSDAYRVFPLLSNLCQSPISWYTSGPAQKYILRQIKAMDSSLQSAPEDSCRHVVGHDSSLGSLKPELDVCLLMLYGHILFTSTSYTYALGYFLRARSIDPQNAMVNLSLGLAYVHSGLKRQASNRQYLLLQGHAFLSQYVENSRHFRDLSTAEVYYNLGRLFQLLGITYLALQYYSRVYRETLNDVSQTDVSLLALVNTLTTLQVTDNKLLALSLLKEGLII